MGKSVGQETILERSTTDKYFTLIERAADAIAIIQDGVFKLVNSALVGISGYDREELLGMPFIKLLTPESRNFVMARYRDRLAGKEVPSSYETEAITKNGEVRNIEINGVLTEHEGRAADEVIIRDITKRKWVEKALQQSEGNLKAYLERAPDGVYLNDLKGTFFYGNKKAEEIMGYKREELVGKSFLKLNLLPAKYLAKAGKLLGLNAMGRPTGPDELELRKKDGSRIWAEINTTPIKQGGKVVVIGFVRDITERKRVEEELRIKDSAIASSINAIAIADLEGNLTYVNHAFLRMWGYDDEKEILGKNAVEFWRVAEEAVEVMQAGIDRGGWIGELAAKRKDGSIFDVQLSASVVRNEAGKPICRLGSFVDITERKQVEKEIQDKNEELDAQNEELQALNEELRAANEELQTTEEELRESEEKYRHLFDGLNDAAFLADVETGLIVEANQQAMVMLGRSRDEIVGMHQSELHPPGQADKYRQKFATHIQKGHAADHDSEVIRKDGTVVPVTISASPLTIRDRRFILGLFRDITERKRAEEKEKQLQQELNLTSRLASIGQMASGVAHEINNPLTGVIGFSQLLMRRDIPDDIRDDLQIINSEAQRVARIVEGLLTFAHQHKPGREYVDINHIIPSVLELRSYEMKVNNIEVMTQFAPDLPQTKADGSQLQQVFLNITLNAEREMITAHNRGRLSVKTEKIGNSIRVSFTDDGPGISKENLDKIFDPFFTTREVGDGTGLGLSICHGIVSQHNGRIYAKSELGKGATFVVELPIVAETGKTEKAWVIDEEPSKRNGAKVLVVDDEKTILAFLKHLLTEQGCEVATTDEAHAAVERLRSEKYDLILLDIKMPVMDGIELYHHIEATDPALAQRVIFITGDLMETTTRDFLNKTKAPHIAKPFDIEQLKKDINHILIKDVAVQ